MNKEVANRAGSLPVSAEDLEKGLQNMQSSVHSNTGGLPFLRLMKSGLFVYGAENIEVEEGSEWVINPYSLMHGFACWAPGELLDERMVPFTQPPPNKAELPDLGQSWDQQVAMQLACTSGEDTGTNVLYKGTSTGLRNASKELINAILEQLQDDKENICPVVELESDSYRHKEFGQIFFPILRITAWMTMDGVASAEAAPEESEAEPAPKAEEPEAAPTQTRRRRAGAGKTSKAAATDEQPTTGNRRRRRRAS